MKLNTSAALIILFIVFVIIYLGWNYIFSIYEVVYEVTPKVIYADNQSIVTIKAVPINSFGKKALFRSAHCEFKITEGEELVQLLKNDPASGIFKLKSKEQTGVIVIRLKSKYSLLPSEIKIEIAKNSA